jgi:hypothetical protein
VISSSKFKTALATTAYAAAAAALHCCTGSTPQARAAKAGVDAISLALAQQAEARQRDQEQVPEAEAPRADAIDRYLTLLKSGGSDHPMPLLQRAGVDLSRPETVRAVVDQLDALVTKLDAAIGSLP